MKVIDTHCHIGRWGEWDFGAGKISPFPIELDNEDSFRDNYLNRFNPDYVIVVPHYVPDIKLTFRINHLVLRFCNFFQNVYGGVWLNAHPDALEDSYTALNSFSSEKLIVYKFSPDTWGSNRPDPNSWNQEMSSFMDEVISSSIRNQIVIQFHTGMNRSDPSEFARFLEVFGHQGVKVQFIHMGNLPGGHFKFVPLFIEWQEKGFNTYCDMSWAKGFAPRWLIHELKARNMPIDHVLFASDEPWGDYSSEIARVNNLEISYKEREDILYNNAYNLYLSRFF